MEVLLEHGAAVDALSGDGETALTAAASGGHVRAMRVLLDRRADVNAVRGDGITALAQAAYGGHLEAMEVLLAHGGGQTRNSWGGTMEELIRRGFHVVSVDLRGHGDSDWSPDGDYDLQRFADDVIAVARSFGRPPALVGASLGGLASMLALATVAEDPAETARGPLATCLVLVDVAPRVEDEGRIKIQEFMRSGMRGFDTLEEAADSIAVYNPHRPRPKDLSGLGKNLRERGDGRWYWHWDPRFITGRSGVDGQRGRVNHERMQGAASRIDIPTLLVRGRMSDIVSDESVRELRELVPQSEVVDVAGAGHMVAGDRNDAFNQAVIDFVDRVMPAAQVD